MDGSRDKLIQSKSGGVIPNRNVDVKNHSEVLEQDVRCIHLVQVLVPINQEILMLSVEDLAQGCKRSDGIWRMNQSTVQSVRGNQLVNPSRQKLVLPKHLLAKGDQFIKLVLQIFIPLRVWQGSPY